MERDSKKRSAAGKRRPKSSTGKEQKKEVAPEKIEDQALQLAKQAFAKDAEDRGEIAPAGSEADMPPGTLYTKSEDGRLKVRRVAMFKNPTKDQE